MELLNGISVNNNICCKVCRSGKLELVKGYDNFPQVTSDCKLWRGKSSLCVCGTCGLVQKVTDQAWEKDTQSIYSDYTLYHQANGIEQAVFDIHSGKVSRRSERIFQYIKTKIRLLSYGRYLDLGCGKGNTLRYFSKLRPLWSLSGKELSPKCRKVIESISKRARFYSCPLKKIPGTFDLITMFHLLEHIVDPVTFLVEVRTKMADSASIVIDIPDYRQNPFDLFVVDHCMHFTVSTLDDVLSKAGFETVDINTSLIPKELVVIAKKTKIVKDYNGAIKSSIKTSSLESVTESLAWVKSFLEKAGKVTRKDNFGIFGTSIIATWLLGKVGRHVRFFVDEDPGRQGKTYMNLPVYNPQDIPKGSSVFFALPSGMAFEISKRLFRPDVKFFIPPPFKIRG